MTISGICLGGPLNGETMTVENPLHFITSCDGFRYEWVKINSKRIFWIPATFDGDVRLYVIEMLSQLVEKNS